MTKERNIREWTEFANREFAKENWEDEIKKFILSLDKDDHIIWHKRHWSLKKICEELTTLGYYVKYKYIDEDRISFRLNQTQEKIDGYIRQGGEPIETLQIVTSFYDKEENKLDQDLMQGKEVCTGGLVWDRLTITKERIKKRIKLKMSPKKNYKDIDTLLIGTRGWFVANTKRNEYWIILNDLQQYISSISEHNGFKRISIVDVDYVGNGAYVEYNIR